MNVLTLNIRYEEPILRVFTPVTACQTKRSGLELKQLDVKAMWDTGSMVTCVSKRLVRYLGLNRFESMELSSLHGSSVAKVCLMDIVLPDGVSLQNVRATEIETPSNFDIIIGMNIIRLGDFALSNDHGCTVMSFSLPATH